MVSLAPLVHSAVIDLYHPLAVSRFWSSWSNPKLTKPEVVNVFYVNHQGHQVWKDYDKYLYVFVLSDL